ncbi:unnamed protein product [Amoebophrya sp. A120]|nr:unnamed protein product [Amoebophrya sp. A120]|eukprot:GSA120T00010834001.1
MAAVLGGEEAVEIEFNIEPGDGRTPQEVFATLQQQLADPFSTLRRSEFGQYCTQAVLYSEDAAQELSQPSKIPIAAPKPALPQSDVPAKEILELQEKHRQEIQRLEMLLRERENISTHAKEMWLAESSRAAKLGESLERAEKKINELEKNLSQLSIMYNEASQELRQLKHIFGNNNSRGSEFGGGGAGAPGGSSSPGGYARSIGAGSVPASQQLKGWLPASPSRNPNLVASPSARLALDTSVGSLGRTMFDDAVLYEDDLMQIGIKSRYRDLDGELALFFGNKSAKISFHNFQTEYAIKEDTLLRLSMTTAPAMIEAGTQHSQRVTATCVGPYLEAPILRLSFLLSDNSPRRIQVRLPLSIDKFLDPLELSAMDFFGVWRDHDYTVNEECAVVDIAAKFQESSSLAPLAKAVCLGDVLKLLPGVDSNPDNLVLAAKFSSDTVLNLLVCRVEIGSGAFRGKARVACRSNNSKLSKAVCTLLQNKIAAQNANDPGK